jgi:long-chain fatty acid transport protein
MRIRAIRIAAIVACFSVCLWTGSAFGAGFALIEQGVSGLGNAMAGGAASAEDATTIFFNPAGMTRLPSQAMAATHVIVPDFKFKNQGSTHALQPLTGTPLLGGNGGNAGVTKISPNLYLVKKLDNQIVFGLGVNSPFGLATKYDHGWVGRYHAIESDLLSVNINPSIGYRVNNQLSFGLGADITYMKATLSNAIDYGTIAARFLIPGAIPQGQDGYVKLTGDAWGAGFNVGMLYEFTKDTRVGMAYRSQVNYTLEGDAKFSAFPIAAAPAVLKNQFRNDNIRAKLTTPDTLSMSLFHQLNPKWAIMGDITWTNWKTFDELRIEFADGRADSVVTTEWKDVFRYSLGTTFTPNDTWTFRAGVAYDQAPISSNTQRTARIPDGDRKWLALGAGYKATKNLTFNAGYVHLFIDDTKITKTATGEDAIRGGLTGKYTGSVNIFSAEAKWVF